MFKILKIPWNQDYIREAQKNPIVGEITVEFERDGVYGIEISRWSFESGLEINQGVEGHEKAILTYAISEGVAVNFTKGKTSMSAWFMNEDNVNWGALHIKITREI